MFVHPAGMVGFVALPSLNAKQIATSPLWKAGSVALFVPAATPT
jgi:hypothetical protein